MATDYAVLVASVGISLLATYAMMPLWIRFMHGTGVVGYDIMKRRKIAVADMGGPPVVVGFLLGLFTYIAFGVFGPGGLPDLISVLASMNTILIITLIGVFDALTSKMKEREGKDLFERMKRRGIPSWAYYFIPLPAAVPLMAVNAGFRFVNLPFLGRIELGILYPLVMIPLAVLCCSNATNFLAGFNGLEAGMGSVLMFSLGTYAVVNGRTSAAVLAFTYGAALLAFLRFNWYPAQVFPGDLNHAIGAVVVCVTLLGNMEKFSILCFTPWILEAFLKLGSHFKAESYGVLQPDGTVKPKEPKIRGLTHLVMSMGGFKEWQVTQILVAAEAVICAAAFLLVRVIR